MIKRVIIMIVALAIMLVNADISAAENSWEMGIKAKALNAENRLTIGQRPDASDGIDSRYDVPALLAGDIEAYTEIENNKYWKNIKESCNTPCKKTWDIFVESKTLGQIMELSWDSLNIPDDISIILIDTATGKIVDMKKEQHKYTFENRGKRKFIIEAQLFVIKEPIYSSTVERPHKSPGHKKTAQIKQLSTKTGIVGNGEYFIQVGAFKHAKYA